MPPNPGVSTWSKRCPGKPSLVRELPGTVRAGYWPSIIMLTLACYGNSVACDTNGATTDTYYKYVYDSVGNRQQKHRPFVGITKSPTANA